MKVSEYKSGVFRMKTKQAHKERILLILFFTIFLPVGFVLIRMLGA